MWRLIPAREFESLSLRHKRHREHGAVLHAERGFEPLVTLAATRFRVVRRALEVQGRWGHIILYIHPAKTYEFRKLEAVSTSFHIIQVLPERSHKLQSLDSLE